MKFAFRDESAIFVLAASTMEEFDRFKFEWPLRKESDLSGRESDLLDSFADPRLLDLKLMAFIVEGEEAHLARLIESDDIQIVAPEMARENQNKMIELYRLDNQYGRADRRSIADVIGVPLPEKDEEMAAQDAALDEIMKQRQQKGEITNDSFSADADEFARISKANVVLDKEGNVDQVKVQATKAIVKPYEIVIDGAPFDFEKLWDAMLIPENRIVEVEGNTAVVKLHVHQLDKMTHRFDLDKLSYRITAMFGREAEEDIIAGPPGTSVFFSLQVTDREIGTVLPTLQMNPGFDAEHVLAMRNVDGGCWLAFLNEQTADQQAAFLLAHDITGSVIAVNRTGKPILSSENTVGARVIDTNEQIVKPVRPWNEHADEFAALSDDAKDKLMRTVQAAEFYCVVETSKTLRTAVFIVPVEHFEQHETFWDGEITIDHLVPQHTYERVHGLPPYIFAARNLPEGAAFNNLHRIGFKESMMFQAFINEYLEEAKLVR